MEESNFLQNNSQNSENEVLLPKTNNLLNYFSSASFVISSIWSAPLIFLIGFFTVLGSIFGSGYQQVDYGFIPFGSKIEDALWTMHTNNPGMASIFVKLAYFILPICILSLIYNVYRKKYIKVAFLAFFAMLMFFTIEISKFPNLNQYF